MGTTANIRKRISNLKEHLGTENPELGVLVEDYEAMDTVLRRLRLLGDDESLTSRISWWPVVSVLGMFSAGKSTAINDFLGQRVQRTSKQAQDDKFTVLCYGPENAELPGTALALDSRFPFYGMSDEIEKVAPGEGKKVDSFLALKTVPSESLRGLIMVDSPGFDSDDYRAAQLRMADHILDLSDMVMVYCDANRPEPGAMRDTLNLLVTKSQQRADSDKFVYVLNQIDVVGYEDNIQDVVGAWQRAMSTAGLTTGRFYTVYSESAQVDIKDADVASRLRAIRDRDMGELRQRIMGLHAKRGYRIVSSLQAVEKVVAEEAVPTLATAVERWRRRANMLTLGAYASLVGLAMGASSLVDHPFSAFVLAAQTPDISAAVAVVGAVGIHWKIGRMLAWREAAKLPEKYGEFDLHMRAALLHSTRMPPVLVRGVRGGGNRMVAALARIRESVSNRVRTINDHYASPSASMDVAARIPDTTARLPDHTPA